MNVSVPSVVQVSRSGVLSKAPSVTRRETNSSGDCTQQVKCRSKMVYEVILVAVIESTVLVLRCSWKGREQVRD